MPPIPKLVDDDGIACYWYNPTTKLVYMPDQKFFEILQFFTEYEAVAHYYYGDKNTDDIINTK